MTADLCELNARGGVLDVTIIHNFLLQIVETSAQPTARPNFESAMGASALAQVRFSTQTSAARYGCAELSWQ